MRKSKKPKNSEVSSEEMIQKERHDSSSASIDIPDDELRENMVDISVEDLPEPDKRKVTVEVDNILDISDGDLSNIDTDNISFLSGSRSISPGIHKEMPVFIQRSPRIKPPLPDKEVEVPKPPQAPIKPNISWFADLMYPIMMIIVGFAMYASMKSPFSFVIVAMAIVTLTVSINRNTSQNKKYAEESQTRKEKYSHAMKLVWGELNTIKEQVQDLMLDNHADMPECLRRVAIRDRRLWERNPDHDDFLDLRLGIGSLPFPIKVKYPPKEITIHDDPLLQDVHKGEERFRVVEGVPICLPLLKGSTAGIIGDRKSVLHTTRALLTQLTVHHSYDEVKIVAVYNNHEQNEWNWLKKMPHAMHNNRKQQFTAHNKEQVHQLLSAFYDLIKKRELLSAGQSQAQLSRNTPYIVFVIADRMLVERESIMRYLLQNNQALGIISIYLYDQIGYLPPECSYIVNVNAKNGQLINRISNMQTTAFIPDTLPIRRAEDLSINMAPLRLQQLFPTDDLSEMISLLDLYGVSRIEDLNIRQRWLHSKAYSSLSALLGVRVGGEQLSLDIHDKHHGPHGLVAGTTGSGKSELLQSLILSLAINYHPHDVMFVLIDYKGGGMANVFKGLPHLAGIITNLEGNQTNRALLSVKSELHRRQTLFDQVGVNHIDKYIQLTKQGRTEEAIPHLVIIVDEFAELKSEQPDFMRELVSTARVGRSLGVHLILATQKPAGVVDEQIWSNARFKICLKVQSTEDSQEMLKRPDASMITVPGRAYVQVGNDEIYELFQSAYSGVAYMNPLSREVVIKGPIMVDLDDTLELTLTQPEQTEKQETTSQLDALVQYISNTASQDNIEQLKGQWLPPLPEMIALEPLATAGGWDGDKWCKFDKWLAPVVGMVDNPAGQTQYPLQVDLGRDGHLAIYGAPGSGKTTFIQTMITSLALAYSPEDVNIYILDFGGRTLNGFKALPHVGGVVTVDDEEKLKKLIKMLLRELDKRKRLFAESSVGSLTAYRDTGGEVLPALVIAVDNYPALNELYPDTEEFFLQISREGGNLGLHLVLSAGGVTSIQYKIVSNIKQMVTLQLADKGDYSTVVGRTGGLEPEAVNGRGLVKSTPPLEFQTALAVDGETEADRSAALSRLLQNMDRKWKGKRAKPIPVIPEILKQKDLFTDERVIEKTSADPLQIALGLDTEELEPVFLNMNDTPHFLVTGKIKCGKTAFLKSWLMAMSDRFAPEELKVFIADSYAMGLYSLRNLPHVGGYAGNQPQLNDVFDKLKSLLEKQREAIAEMRASTDGGENMDEADILVGYPRVVLLIDDFNDFMQMAEAELKDSLEKLIARERAIKFHLLTAAMINDIGSNWETLAKTIKDCQAGLLMAEALEQQVFNIRVSYSEGGVPLHPGEGYLVNRGQYKKIKVAMI